MTIALLAIILLLAAALLWVIARPKPATSDPALSLMHQQIESLRQQVSQSLSQNATLLQSQLESVNKGIHSSSTDVNQRLDKAAKLYADLNHQLGQITQGNIQIQSMMKDVSSLQDILRPPKLRGGMGEVMLENLLREILPAEHYAVQHHFRSGTIVDAIIRLSEGIVPVDAKFPLENFKRMLEATNDDDRKAARKEFARNVKKHIDDIHNRYILPEEGTFPFALMYIPAENVYYETIIRGEEEDGEKAMYKYAIDHQVMPVSPNSFYAYLLTLAQGFRGMRVEERAKEIMDHLNRLRVELERFGDDFRKIGLHIGNAQKSFGDSEKRLTRFEDKLIAAGEGAHAPELTEPASESLASSTPRLL